MFIVENFLCCFQLETGGLFIGWLGLITDTITIALLLLACIGIPQISCDKIIKAFAEAGKAISYEDCDTYRTVIVVVFAICILFLLGFIVIYYLLIKGTKKRDHTLIRPAVICCAVSAILLVAGSVLTFTANGLVSAVVYGLLYGYIFACLYSLYVKVRDEKQGNAQYMHP